MTITSWEDDFDHLYIGQTVCMYGIATGEHCDEIAFLNAHYPLRVGRVAMAEREASGGDSGGPLVLQRDGRRHP